MLGRYTVADGQILEQGLDSDAAAQEAWVQLLLGQWERQHGPRPREKRTAAKTADGDFILMANTRACDQCQPLFRVGCQKCLGLGAITNHRLLPDKPEKPRSPR